MVSKEYLFENLSSYISAFTITDNSSRTAEGQVQCTILRFWIAPIKYFTWHEGKQVLVYKKGGHAPSHLIGAGYLTLESLKNKKRLF
jgi:hypothetical protein